MRVVSDNKQFNRIVLADVKPEEFDLLHQLGEVKSSSGGAVFLNPTGFEAALKAITRKQAITMTRGLPGSGKSTWARTRLTPNILRVNRDKIREMLAMGKFRLDESLVVRIQNAIIDVLLEDGKEVILDNTHLTDRHVEEIKQRFPTASVDIRDFMEVSIQECIARQAGRPEAERVPEERILQMAKEVGLTADVVAVSLGATGYPNKMHPVVRLMVDEALSKRQKVVVLNHDGYAGISWVRNHLPEAEIVEAKTVLQLYNVVRVITNDKTLAGKALSKGVPCLSL